jgi:NAD(P)-dependent dehydrogenase (short-subunit alcohol dehydrogenase family)
MNKTCIVLGSGSDIMGNLEPFLRRSYKIHEWKRGESLPLDDWDLVICSVGTVAPVGLWHSVDEIEWLHSIESNLITPFRLLQRLWPTHNPGASVCFMAGSNPQMVMSGYSAYNTGKMALLKMVEQLDHESPDAKFFALGPGTILTKIHKPTMDAGWDNPKLAAALAKDEARELKIRQVYECLMWAIDQPKDVIGGRNICVSDQWGPGLACMLKADPWMYKLRRVE